MNRARRIALRVVLGAVAVTGLLLFVFVVNFVSDWRQWEVAKNRCDKFLTVGMTEEKLLKVMGKPLKVTDTVRDGRPRRYYLFSSFFLADDQVTADVDVVTKRVIDGNCH